MNGYSEPTPTKPWPLKAHLEEQDDSLPPTSQSWPQALDISARSSFGTAGESLGFDQSQSPEETFGEDSLETNADSPWSPAAAFLSSFLSSTPPPSDASRLVVAGYALGPIISFGGFSTIRQATSPSGGVVAVKIVRHTAFDSLPPGEKARQRSRLSHEARVWVSLSHENILPLFDSHRTSDATYLITLYCPAGSLFDILKREGTPALEQTDAGCMFRQVVKALHYLHLTKGLVHGDIKLENVLVDESGVCRLTDFGLTRRIGSSQVSSSASEEDYEEASQKKPRDRSRRAGTTGLPVHLSLMRHGPQRHRNSSPSLSPTAPLTHPDHMFQPGSLPYAAPELLLPHSCCTNSANGRPTAHPAQDMWALGVLLYALLTGKLPFCDLFEPRLQMKILRGTYEIPPGIGPLAESVLKGCLDRDASDRWTITMVDDASWGIGYGNIDMDSNLHEEERSPLQPHLHTSSYECPPSCGNLPASMSSLSLGSSPPVDTSMSRGRPPRLSVRSRSPSPSVAPRTPDDDDDDDAMFFGRRRNLHRPQGDAGDVQIVSGDEHHKWDSRDPTYHRNHEGASPDAVQLPLQESKLDRMHELQRKQDDARSPQSRTLSWPLNERTR